MAHYLVIAASSAIGQAVVRNLRAEGNTVFTTARNTNKITPDAILDARDFSAVREVFHLAGPLDGVVCCSGSLFLRSAHLTTAEQFQAVIDCSLTTAFATVSAAGALMTKGGSVVLIASAAAQIGLANHEAIAAAKGGAIALARSAAATYAGSNLRFNVVAPGLTESPLTDSLIKNPASLAISKSLHPLGRIGQPEDIAQAIVFLLNPQNNWITGQVLAVDGGLSSIKPKIKM